jgi:hypothetical protein
MRLFIKNVLHRQSGLSAQRFACLGKRPEARHAKRRTRIGCAVFFTASLDREANDQRDSPN